MPSATRILNPLAIKEAVVMANKTTYESKSENKEHGAELIACDDHENHPVRSQVSDEFDETFSFVALLA